jgi:hypothetical protein
MEERSENLFKALMTVCSLQQVVINQLVMMEGLGLAAHVERPLAEISSLLTMLRDELIGGAGAKPVAPPPSSRPTIADAMRGPLSLREQLGNEP